MTATLRSGTCACDAPVGSRLRYVYGRRLTAADLADEQAYLLGQTRFLAQRVLGSGVLCGLRSEHVPPPEGRSPAIRVGAGAALDGCGRRIVVEADHCLDVGAWFAARRDELGWDQPGTYPAWVGLRYAEHPSHPVTVPRDPCGCEDGACAYGRVRDGFELVLHAEGGPAEVDARDDPLPQLCEQAGAGVDPALLRSPDDCPACRCEAWLLLAGVEVQVEEIAGGGGLRATGASTDDTDPRRRDLLSLADVHRLLAGVAGAVDGWCAEGPTLGPVSGEGDLGEDDALDEARLAVDVVPAHGPDDGIVELAASTFDPDTQVRLTRLGDGGWEPLDADVTYEAGERQIRLVTDAAELDTPYRLQVVSDPDRPLADLRLRPLRPSAWSRTVVWGRTDDSVTFDAHP